MTSLARQLERLSVPHTQSALTADKRRVSLLFDPKEAANFDREAVFALGQSGLEELENIDDTFCEYESSLFNQSSQSWERTMQTHDVNTKLDQTIHRFLVHVSPYLLLKSSHKTLEWLIYRYHIHQINIDDLILCSLPYHDTKIFVRILQLVKLSDPTNKWNWLNAAAISGTPLARGTLVNHCRKDPGFLSVICELLPKFIKVHGSSSPRLRSVISMVTCSILATINHRDDITERIVSILVPHLATGLKSKCVDLVASSYMILSQLCSQVNVKESVLGTLLPIITKKLKRSLSLEGLSCVCLIYQTQKVTQLPKKSFKSLCRIPGLVELLANLSNQCVIPEFIRVFTLHLIPVAVEKGDLSGLSSTDGSDDFGDDAPVYASLLLGILQDINLEGDLPNLVSKMIMRKLMEKRQETNTHDALNNWTSLTRSFLKAIQMKYNSALDDAVKMMYEENKNSDVAMGYLQEMTSLTSMPMKYQQVGDSNCSLILGLNHASKTTRILAVKQLVQSALNDESPVDSFITEAVLTRLQDDQYRVVEEVLQLKEKLLDILPADKVKTSLLKILHKGYEKSKWVPSLIIVVDLLCTLISQENDSALLVELLPFLLVTDAENTSKLTIAKTILGIGISKKVKGLQLFSQDWIKVAAEAGTEKIKNIHQLNEIVVCGLAKFFITKEKTEFKDSIGKLVYCSSTQAAYLSLLVLTQMLESCKKWDTKLTIAGHILTVVNKAGVADAKFNCTLDKLAKSEEQKPAWLDVLQKHNQLPIGVVIWSISSVTEVLAGVKIKDVWCNYDNPHHRLLLDVLNLILHNACAGSTHSDTWQKLIGKWINNELDLPCLMKLATLIWTTPDLSALLKVGSFHIVQKKVDGYSGNICDLLTENKSLIPSLLLSLLNEHLPVRSGALECLKQIRKNGKHHLHGGIIKKLIKREEEILADPLHTKQVIGVYFSSDAEDRKNSLDDLAKCICDQTTPLCVKERLLSLVLCVPHELIFKQLIPLGKTILETLNSGDHADLKLQILKQIMLRYDTDSAPNMKVDGQELVFLNNCLNSSTDVRDNLYLVTIKQIKQDFFHALPSLEVQQRLVAVILDTIIAHKDSANLVSEATSCLRHLKLNGEHVKKELTLEEQEIGTVRSRKRTKVMSKPVNYLRLVFILEVLETRKKIKDSVELAEMLFSVLKRLLTENKDETEYCKQLILTILCTQCSKWTQDNKPQNQECMNIELLVHCIRNSPSPQTQQQALMVMSSVASLFPEYILHNVMSVFTFMGNNLLQQEDNHSYQVTVRTLETLIPAIIQAQSESGNTSRDLITKILQVFVDARHHIPKHRSQLLFHKVLQTVGLGSYGWVLAVQVVESSVRKKDVPDIQDAEDIAEKDKSPLEKDLDFICKLCEDMKVSQRVKMANSILKFLQKYTTFNQDVKGQMLGQPAKLKQLSSKELYPVHCETLTPQQLRLVQFNVTKLVVLLLSKEIFVSQMLDALNDPAFTGIFQSFVKESLSYITNVAKVYGTHSGVPSGKFWKAVLAKSYEILDKVNYLLPSSSFLSLIAPLINHEQPGVRTKAMELLSNKLQQMDGSQLNDDQINQLLNMIDMLLFVVSSNGGHNETETIILKQFALFSLKVLCKLLGSQRPKSFTKILPVIVQLLSSEATSAPVIGNCLLCLAELCTSLKAHVIPYLNAFMTPLLKVLGKLELLKSNDLVLVCSLTAIQRILYSLAHFMSPYLKQILTHVSLISCFVDVDMDMNKKSPPVMKLRTVRHHLATDIPTRVLIPALAETYNDLEENKSDNVKKSLQCLLHILKEHVETISKDDMTTHQVGLREFFCKSLDIRNTDIDLSHEDLLTLEDLCIETLLSMVVRLSEMSFRPLYYRLYDWACREDTQSFKKRRITFFRLSQRLSARLKSLFNMFVSHSLKMSCQMLDQNNTYKSEVDFYGTDQESIKRSCELIEYIMGMIYNVLLHDTDDFVTREIFNMLLQPLVNQIENFIGPAEQYSVRITNQVVPCISQLIVASRDDSLWKALSYQVCLKTRHNSPKVRFATLQVIESIAKKLGEEYMGILPETIPFLAELMEDESEEVEQQCQQVVTSLEEILGESLQKYF